MTPRPFIGVLLTSTVLALGGCGSSDEQPQQSAAPLVEIDGGAIVRDAGVAEAEHWKASWCSLSIGQPQADALETMGEPTQTFPDQATWSGSGTRLTAFFDERKRVRQLDATPAVEGCEGSRKAEDAP